MHKIHQELSDLIGKTPLLQLNKYMKKEDLRANIIAKIEFFNPCGSIKDRIAAAMMDNAEGQGLLRPGITIIEPSSGNTGIGLAMVAASKGYEIILTVPDTITIERRNLLKAFGAQLELTPGAKGVFGAIARAQELHRQIPDSLLLSQFDNPANPGVHLYSTGPEIWSDTEGKVDLLVAGVGTGGTISGTGAYLRQKKPAIHIVAVEPAESPVLSGGAPGPHRIQGIGAGFIPVNFNAEVVDEIIPVCSDDAIRTSRILTRTEGLLVGISSGAALCAATQLAREKEHQGKNIVVILPDTGERYLCSSLYDFEGYPL